VHEGRSTGDGRRPRGPGVVYAALSGVIAVALGAIAFTAEAPPPPTIAEFAPSALDVIDDAPPEQTTRFGSAEGSVGVIPGSAPTPTPIPQLDPVDVPRVRRCVGDPPRQIEDPQSPPCVPYWQGDNGGATSELGVTGNEIRIGFPSGGEAYEHLLLTFLNRRFEFYGRQLVRVQLPCSGSQAPEQEVACAKAAADEYDVFASARGDSHGAPYANELARQGVLFAAYQPFFDRDFMDARHPYVWQYAMGADELFRLTGDWICSRFAGRPARYAADAVLRGRPRTFGVVFQQVEGDESLDASLLTDELRSCDAEPEVVIETNYRFSTDFQSEATTIAVQMKSEDVTSVICLCHAISFGDLTRAATSQSYYPEWLASSYAFMDIDWHLRTWSEHSQLGQLMGISIMPRHWPPADHPSVWAAREVDPGFDPETHGVAGTHAADQMYRSMLVLASGIQLAGPNLNPQFFERALHDTAFPNPDHPLEAGDVGFAGDHTMTDDAAEWWWSAGGRSPYSQSSGSGTICYVDGGARRSLGTWPSGDDPFFDPPCDSGASGV